MGKTESVPRRLHTIDDRDYELGIGRVSEYGRKIGPYGEPPASEPINGTFTNVHPDTPQISSFEISSSLPSDVEATIRGMKSNECL